MKDKNMKVNYTLTFALLAVALLGGCAAERLYKDGTSQIESGQFEDGLESLRLAMKESPSDNQYRSAFRRQRDAIMNTLLEAAEKARRDGRFNDADALVRRSRGIDNNNSRIAPVAENIARDRQLSAQLREAEKLTAAGKWQDAEALLRKITLLNPEIKGVADLRRKIDSQRMAYGTSIPVLKARQERPVTLHFRDTGLRTVLEALSRDTGINFILDKDVRADTRVTIFVQQVRVEDAIDLVQRLDTGRETDRGAEVPGFDLDDGDGGDGGGCGNLLRSFVATHEETGDEKCHRESCAASRVCPVVLRRESPLVMNKAA